MRFAFLPLVIALVAAPAAAQINGSRQASASQRERGAPNPACRAMSLGPLTSRRGTPCRGIYFVHTTCDIYERILSTPFRSLTAPGA